ncbi:MAG TPA: hypothetical protein VH395_16705 [Jatrophihabitantaceae bacterium]
MRRSIAKIAGLCPGSTTITGRGRVRAAAADAAWGATRTVAGDGWGVDGVDGAW